MAAKNKSPKAAAKIAFVEAMECLPVTKLPEGAQWSYEIKLDGYRLGASRRKVRLLRDA